MKLISFYFLWYGSRKRSLRTPSNCLLISLILADVVLLITCYIIIAQVSLAGGRPLWGATGEKALLLLLARRSEVYLMLQVAKSTGSWAPWVP